MRTFSPAEINGAFERLAKGRMEAAYRNIQDLGFTSYGEFEKYQHEERQPVWIQAILTVTGCRSRRSLEVQWQQFGAIFHAYHAGYSLDWLLDPSQCPVEVKKARERELEAVIGGMSANRECHWERNHKYVCFCDERTNSQ